MPTSAAARIAHLSCQLTAGPQSKERTLDGKRALVTGSTSGIGYAIAEELCAQGCDVILNGFGDVVEVDQKRASLSSRFGVKVVYFGHDLSDSDEVSGPFPCTKPYFRAVFDAERFKK
jgi:hypothetical protein